MRSLRWLVAAALSVPCLVAAQDTLTLAEALQLAKDRNGDVRAAALGVRAARARVGQSMSAFFPTVTPSYRYNTSRSESILDTGTSVFGNQGSETGVTANWTLLDSGEREWALGSSRRLAEAERFNALTTLRGTLFSVNERFHEALRTQELQRVSDLQVERARSLLGQTETQVSTGDAPQKDILQARADLLNAQVDALAARSRTANAHSLLKATIGWDMNEPLPPLQATTQPETFPAAPPLPDLRARALQQRPELRSQRERIAAQRFNTLRANRQAQFGWALDANYDRLFSPDTTESRSLTFLFSMPLFDGGRTREIARESRLNLEASRSVLAQLEREAEAEVESAYITYTQNVERVQAARLAVEAARLNYDAAATSQREGAAGTNIVTVLTAQVSLVTAESNYIEALYDLFISDARLKLATGETMPGESL